MQKLTSPIFKKHEKAVKRQGHIRTLSNLTTCLSQPKQRQQAIPEGKVFFFNDNSSNFRQFRTVGGDDKLYRADVQTDPKKEK